MTFDIGKREFLAGLALAAAAGTAVAQNNAAPAAANGYKPRRHNKAIELLEDGQPIYYTGADPRRPGYEQGKAMAGTQNDMINWEMEHGTFDIANLREFMRGLTEAGPTRSGHRFPTVLVSMPVLGYSAEMVMANSWVIQQILSTGVNALTLCHTRDPKAVAPYVAAARYPFDYPGVPKQPIEGMRGSGSQILPARMWGVPANMYLNIADVWPLNPKGEIMLGVKIEDRHGLAVCENILRQPGIAFTEGGGGDMQMSVDGLSLYADTGPPQRGDGEQHFSPAVQAAQTRVLNAAKASKVNFLHAATRTTIREWIDRGARVIESGNAEVMRMGREYTRRTMPV
jgi:4-hydroxy-2-oxoheptanedioate aldolase